MPRLLQINVTANWGSTGKITEDIGNLAIRNGWESHIAYGRGKSISNSKLIRVGNELDRFIHALETRLWDNHGFSSKYATRQFISKINKINPDIIHLHNLHGYYLNFPLLFDYLKQWGGPVVYTLHDCWPYTGHCAYYSYIKCIKWHDGIGCRNCPQLSSYPRSIWKDNSSDNYIVKRKALLDMPNLTLVTVSDWLRCELTKSFLKGYPSLTIHNGVDTSVFKPSKTVSKDFSKKIILGVASVWDHRKGLNDFISLRTKLPYEYLIILVGLSKKQIATLPKGIVGLERTNSIHQLIDLYSIADVYVNTSVEETLGMTTIESMACGTPVIVYDATACPETVGHNTGLIVQPHNIPELANAILEITTKDKTTYERPLKDWVFNEFDESKNYMKYLDLYSKLFRND